MDDQDGDGIVDLLVGGMERIVGVDEGPSDMHQGDNLFLPDPLVDGPVVYYHATWAVYSTGTGELLEAGDGTPPTRFLRPGEHGAMLWSSGSIAGERVWLPGASGDLNGDGVVDMQDLLRLVQTLNESDRGDSYFLVGDLNGDGVVDMGDLTSLLSQYGRAARDVALERAARSDSESRGAQSGSGNSLSHCVDRYEYGIGVGNCSISCIDCEFDNPLPPEGGGCTGCGGCPDCPPDCPSCSPCPDCPPPPPDCTTQCECYPCSCDANDNGVPDKDDDDDGDGIPNKEDCDSECYAGDPCEGAFIVIHKPKVIDSGESEIPHMMRLEVGAQTFVNLDNDDRDGLFDLGLGDADIAEENELIKVIIRIPRSVMEGSVTLQATQGAQNILIWRTPGKGEEYSLGDPLSIPTDFQVDSASYFKTLWIEGVAPHSEQRGTRLEMQLTSPNRNCTDRVALTIIGVEKVEWVGQNNSIFDTNELDIDPNWPPGLAPAALRVFPCARFVGGTVEPVPRDRVDVKVTLTVKPIEPVALYLRSFDVDDPTSDAAPIDDDSCATCVEDNRGLMPSRSGAFEDENSGIKSHEFEEKVELVPFRTTMQPGDNFRVVVNGDRNFLVDLHNDDHRLGAENADKQRIVNTYVLEAGVGSGSQQATPEQAEVRDADKYVSPTLTIWRFLLLEVDSMGPVENNFVEGNITSLLPDGDSETATVASVDINLNDDSPSPGRFQNGALTIAQTHTISMINGNGGSSFHRPALGLNVCAVPLPFIASPPPLGPGEPPLLPLAGMVTRIRESSRTLALNITGGVLVNDYIGGALRIGNGPEMTITSVSVMNQEVTINALRIPFRAVDDDLPEGTAIPKPDTSRMVPAFGPAYVLPIHVQSGEQDDLQFIAHMETRGPAPYLEAVREGWSFDHQVYDNLRHFWIVYLRGSFQDTTAHDDNDPNGSGVTWGIADGIGNGQGVNIYAEVLRPLELAIYAAHAITEVDVVVHEIGHLFGGLHQHGGVMWSPSDAIDFGIQGATPRSQGFAPITQHIIRSINNP